MGFVYYLVVQLPNIKIAKLDLERVQLTASEDKDEEEKINACLEESLSRYRDRWQKNCESLGRKLDEDGRCGLPSTLVSHLDSEYKNLRDECIERYK